MPYKFYYVFLFLKNTLWISLWTLCRVFLKTHFSPTTDFPTEEQHLSHKTLARLICPTLQILLLLPVPRPTKFWSEWVNSHISRPNLNLGQQNILAQLVSLFSRPWLHHGLSTLQVLNLSSLNKHIVKVSLTGFSVHLLLIPPSLVQHVHFSLLGHVVNCSPEYCYRFSFSSQSMTTTLRWTFRL